MRKIRIKFAISLILLLSSGAFVFFFRNKLIAYEQIIYIILFIYFLLDTFEVILPFLNKSIYSSKMTRKMYIEVPHLNENKLKEKMHFNNQRALIILILYTLGVATIGFSYLYIEWFTKQYIYLIFFAINFGDYFCILIWCPFQSLFLKSSCCNTCRISNWDRWMKFSILLFIPNFFTITINIIAFGIFTYWEYSHYKYPQRFYRISNKRLWCINCDKEHCGKSLIKANKKDCSV